MSAAEVYTWLEIALMCGFVVLTWVSGITLAAMGYLMWRGR